MRIFHRPTQGLYAVHGEDAVILANDFYKSPKMLKEWGSGERMAKKHKTTHSSTGDDDRLAYVSVREGLEFEDVLRFFLFTRQLRVEIWTPQGNSWAVAHRVKSFHR